MRRLQSASPKLNQRVAAQRRSTSSGTTPAGSAGTVNTLSTFQIQYALAFAAQQGWMASGLGEQYLAIVDRIKMSGFGDPERDKNFYYQGNPKKE